jgi:hypothetical protein
MASGRAPLWPVVGALLVVGLFPSTQAAGTQGGRSTAPAQAAATVAAETAPWPDARTLADRRREAERLRLFRGEEPLVLTLKADFRAVQRDRNPASTTTFPASIEFTGADGATSSMPLRIRTRGHSRRSAQTCTFAPLRLEFDKPLSKGTVFDGHGSLKLGTHCRAGSEDVILREYAIYRMFNLLTPRSFRARLAKATYVDTVRKQTVADAFGLVTEDEDDVAKRLEGRITTLEKVIFARVDQDALNLMMLFEYMIGNTDFSIYVQHNVRLVQTPAGARYPVPYDFDYSGLVDAGYSVPARGLPIASVRDRLYRGPCRTAEEWKPYFDRMRAAKADLLAVYDTVPGLSAGYRKDARAYLEGFYRVIDSPAMAKKALIDGCVKMGM